MPELKQTMKDRIEQEIRKDKDDLSDYAIAERLGCSHVLVWKTRHERFVWVKRASKGRDNVIRRLPGRRRVPTGRHKIERQVSELIQSLSEWCYRSASVSAFLRRKQAQIDRAFARLKLEEG